MLLSTSGFVTICPKKEVELGADKHLHRADHADELRREIEFEAPSATGNQYAFLPGGAVRALNPSSSMTLAETSNCIAVFKGNLLNKAELALQVTCPPPHITEAQLLLHLYEAMGIDMLSRLNGQYAFCLYDTKQARVLAARDHSGAVPLLEGRTAAGSLVIACGTYLPKGTSQLTEIKAGEYKYGWHALPRPFKCGHRIIAGRASCDYGIRRRSIDAYNAPPARQSIDLPRQSFMEIPRQRHSPHAPTSHSYSHTPGKYMPPHLAAAAAGGASNSNNGFFTRQRATSHDGHHLQQHNHNHGTATEATAAAGGRRRSESNTALHGSRQQHQHQHQAWMAKNPVVASAASAAATAEVRAAVVVKPPPVQTSVTASDLQDKYTEEVGTPGADATSTPCSATSSDHHRRRRRHHRRRSHCTAGTSAAAAAAAIDDDAHSDAGSHVSSSTHDSANSSPTGPPAASTGKDSAPAGQASNHRTAVPTAAKASGKKQLKPTSALKSAEQQQQQQCSDKRGAGSGGFKRNSSCGELAALGGSPVPHSVLLAAPQGLAC